MHPEASSSPGARRFPRLWPAGRTLLCLALAFAGSGCALAPEGATSERRAWLAATFFEDHQLLWLRDPLLVEQKFAKMARDPYRFLRGTVPQYFRDLSEDASLATRAGNAESARIWLVGDPHPENIGTFRDGEGRLPLEFNDFDAARFGPYHFDVRRLALGYAVLLAMAFDDEPGARAADISELVGRTYAEEIARLDERSARAPVEAGPALGRAIANLAALAQRRGDANAPLRSFTRIADGERVWNARAASDRASLGPEDDALIPLGPEERHSLDRVLASYLQESALDPGTDVPVAHWPVVRRLGAGVSSLPLLRYYALNPGDPASTDDDVLLELKEARDPPALPGLPFSPGRAFRTNAERIVFSQRILQSQPHLDPWLGCSAGLAGYRVRELSGYQEGLDAGDLVDGLRSGALSLADMTTLAHTTATLLARTHARGRVLEGTVLAGTVLDDSAQTQANARVALQHALAGREEVLADDVRDFVARYAPRLLDDYAIFLQMLDEEGPDLGFSAIR